MIVTFWGWVWILGGWMVGLAVAVLILRATDGNDSDRFLAGGWFVIGWMFAPAVLIFGGVILIGWGGLVLAQRLADGELPRLRKRPDYAEISRLEDEHL